ncbi:MAG: MmgE/PrpD family protein [Chloroflexota bacterium]
MAKNYTSTLAEYAAGMRWEDLPAPVVSHAKRIVMDTIGCGLFGSSLPWSGISAKVLAAMERTGKSGVWGTPRRMSSAHATLANGSAAHSFELDDLAAAFHTGAVTLVPALAVAQETGHISGRTLLTAVIAGTEVGRRVADCVTPETVRPGFYFPALISVFAAAAAVGKIVGLSDREMVYAFSHAGSQAGGLMAVQYGGMMKRMLLGRAAQTGVYSALLAQAGYTGIEDIFELGFGGFCSTFTDTGKTADLSTLVEGLGKKYGTLIVKFKRYSCRGPIHTSLDIIRSLRQDGHRLDPNEIQRVTLRVPRWVKEVVGWQYVPRDIAAAQLNLTYSVAVMLLDGDAFVDQYTEEKIRSPRVLDLIRRTTVVSDPVLDGAFPQRPSIVDIVLKNGQTVSRRMERALEFTEAEMMNKFRRLAGKVASARRIDKIVEQVNSLDRMEDVSELAETLTFGRGKGR